MLVIGITSRALFDLDLSHDIFTKEGLESYRSFQISNENVPLKPGRAFPLVKKLLSLYNLIDGKRSVEVILLSRNSSDTGLRIFNSIEHHNLDIKRAVFCSGGSPHSYAKSFGAHLFLSTETSDCRSSIQNGVASARIFPSSVPSSSEDTLKVAFDGDSVIFSEDSQSIYDKHGIKAFERNEKNLAKFPLSGGPFKSFLFELHKLQKKFTPSNCPIKIALVTARSAPSHERVIRTLRDWGIRIDECLFLGGLDKGSFLRVFDADIFFDDQIENCSSASTFVPTAHVISMSH